MSNFPTIEEVHKILDDISEELPKDFFRELNEGIILLPEYKLHPESREEKRLYIMGEYSRSITGRRITIYYGSFKKIYYGVSIGALRGRLRDTLIHEFIHHLESLGGEKGLEIQDAKDLQNYRNR
ncbi:MAG TPA: metallopeptidase family protein [Tissierellaceae bacterium]|nr:metallopeptidase family protein [Tissierellaceae bacterium]